MMTTATAGMRRAAAAVLALLALGGIACAQGTPVIPLVSGAAVSATNPLPVTSSSSAPADTNIVQWASGVLGAMANYGTSPGAVLVPGVNAFITNTPSVNQGTSPWVDSITQWGGGALGAMANYGTSPGAVLVPGVNAFVTNIPAVTQSGGPWTQNVTQFGGANVATGTGAGGAGIPRVTVSNDSTVGLVAGGAIIGKVGIDQTTPGTTNAVSATNFPATVATGTGAQGASVPRVTVATDTATVAGSASLPAGTNIVGKIGIDQTTDVTTNGVEIAPTTAAAAAIAPVVSAAAESNHVLKGSAGNLYSVYVTTGATAGFLMVFDATSAPGDGAVTPKQCVQAPANQTISLSFNPGPPESYATGITAVFSSTGCFNKTASATAFFHGSVK